MWEFDISNIGGIRAAEVTVEGGLNVVQASNFSGKSSFMSAVQTVMGTSGMDQASHPLTEDTAEGGVRLETGDTAYEVTLGRADAGAVTLAGEPMLTSETDRTCARLFAFLGENNPIRARVRNDEDITSLLQAPLDIADIDEQIATLKQERAATTRRLEAAERAASNIPTVTEAVTTLEAEIADLRSRRDELAQQSAATADSGSSGDELAECRSRLQTTEDSISRLVGQIERKEAELEEKRRDLSELEIPSQPTVTDSIAEKEARIDTLDLRIDLLERLHRANRRVLEEDELELISAVEQNLMGDEISCWVCGETTTKAEAETRLDALQETLDSLREERASLQEDIADIEATQKEIERQRRREATLEDAVGELKAVIDKLEGDLQQAQARKSRLVDELDELEETIAEEEHTVNDELTDVKARLRTKQNELAEQRDRLDELKERRQTAAELSDEKARLNDELEELRTRKTETQWELKEQFDRAITDVIGRFAPGFDGAYLDVKTDQSNEIQQFELVIARDGRETAIANLSEAEQELVGVMVALAGHRTFDVGDRVPVVLLDGISQLSATNLRRLSEYLADAADILITTAYPEAGDIGGHRISPENWRTVSDDDEPPAA